MPHCAVSAARARARRHQVAHPGQAAEGEVLAAHGHAEPAELGQAAGDGEARRVPHAETVGDAGGDGEHVLGASRPSRSRPGRRWCTRNVDVRSSSCTSPATSMCRHRHDGGAGLPGGDLTRQVRAGQHPACAPGQDGLDHLGHAQVRPLLEALGQAEQRHVAGERAAQRRQHLAKAVRGHGHDHQVGAVDGVGEHVCGRRRVGQHDVGEVVRVPARAGDGVGQRLAAGPQRGGGAGRGDGGDGGAPRAGADDGDLGGHKPQPYGPVRTLRRGRSGPRRPPYTRNRAQQRLSDIDSTAPWRSSR